MDMLMDDVSWNYDVYTQVDKIDMYLSSKLKYDGFNLSDYSFEDLKLLLVDDDMISILIDFHDKLFNDLLFYSPIDIYNKDDWRRFFVELYTPWKDLFAIVNNDSTLVASLSSKQKNKDLFIKLLWYLKNSID